MRLLQQHVVTTRIVAEATLEVAPSKHRVVWPGVAGSGDDKEPDWRDFPVEELDGAASWGSPGGVPVVVLSCHFSGCCHGGGG